MSAVMKSVGSTAGAQSWSQGYVISKGVDLDKV